MKTPLLLLHGALGSKAQFDALATALEPNFNIHRFNFSGHGGEPMPLTGYSFDTFTQDILNYLTKNNISKTNILGYSMGGYAALHFATKYPEKVNKILTLNTKFNWDPLSTAKETAMLNAEKMLEKVPGFANQLMMQHGLNFWKQVLSNTEDMMNSLSKGITLSDDDYKSISCKVTLGVGDKDLTAGLDDNIRVYKLIPNCSLWVIPDTGHPLDKINPDEIIAYSTRFFKD